MIENRELVSQEWYEALIDDLKSIIIERGFNQRWEVIQCKWEIGHRLLQENDNFERAKIYGKEIVTRVSESLDCQPKQIWLCIQFRNQYPDLDNLPEGKAITWHKIVNKYLPGAKEDPAENEWLRLFDVWNFAGRDERFGLEYPGNIPAGIVLNTLYYYTNENDMVFDPMAGGGVTIDCCKFLKRKCLAYDLEPIRDDIKKWDLNDGLPDIESPKLTFLDPPYYKKKETDYPLGSISELDKEGYLDFFVKLATGLASLHTPDTYIALLMSNYIDYDSSQNSIWVDDYVERFRSAGFGICMQIQCPLSTQQYSGYDVNRMKERKDLMIISRELVIFKK